MDRKIDRDTLADVGLLLTVTGLAGVMTFLIPLPGGNPAADESSWCDVAPSEIYLAEPDASSTTEEPEYTHCTDPCSAWVDYSVDYGPGDAYLLAKIAYAEARGEDIEGQALVIRVVLNRVWSDDFPDSIPEVVFQENQFAGTKTEAWNVIDLPEEAYKALELVESGWDESQGATYFCTPRESTWHREHLQELFTHGGHIFFKEEEK